MKKEEQIKQLRVQLLAYDDTVCFTESKLDGLKANRQVVINQLEQLEKDSKETKEDFSDIEITHFTGHKLRITEVSKNITMSSILLDFDNVEYLGEEVDCGRVYKAMRSDSKFVLFFGKKKEKPLKHPHMKDIVATFCISANDEFEVEKLTDADKINWEDWDKVQPIGEDQEYGIVVKATYRKENPNQFSLFFCEKK